VGVEEGEEGGGEGGEGGGDAHCHCAGPDLTCCSY
jgi:hypothetical protein